MARRVPLLSFLVALFAALLAGPAIAGAVVADAAPVTATVSQCSSGYPFQPQAQISVSSSVARVGETVEVSGSNFCGVVSISITINGAVVGHARTNADGVFDPPIRIPGPPGTKQICAIGSEHVTRGSDVSCTTIKVLSASAETVSAQSGNSSSTGSGLASTGVEIGALVALCVLLIGGGAAFVLLGRRRSPTAR